MPFPRDISAHRASVTERTARATAIAERVELLPAGITKTLILWRAGLSWGALDNLRRDPAKATVETLDVFEATFALLDSEGVERFIRRANECRRFARRAEARAEEE